MNNIPPKYKAVGLEYAIALKQDAKTTSLFEAENKKLKGKIFDLNYTISDNEAEIGGLKAEKKSMIEELRTLLRRDYNMADAYYIKIDVFEAFKSKYLEE
jgi:hypothetical protein